MIERERSNMEALPAPASIQMQRRIPAALQKIFMLANQGVTIDKPPPARIASMEFVRGALNHRKNNRNDPASAACTKNRTYQVAKRNGATKITLKPSLLVPPSRLQPHAVSPQDYLDSIMTSRGYSLKRYTTLQTAYYSKPTPLQRASYQSRLLQVVAQRDCALLRQMLAAGLSPNPCNAFSESLVHAVCRRGESNVLQVFLQAGASVQISDDYGRTPLHDACWAAQPSFETVMQLLTRDAALVHMQDARGALPLSYIHKDHWDAWRDFLQVHADEFWPVVGQEPSPSPPCLQQPNSSPLRDPENALPADLAYLVATGRVDPLHVMIPADYDDEDDFDSLDGDSMDGEGDSSDEETPDAAKATNGPTFTIGEIQVVDAPTKSCNRDDDSLSRTSCTTDFDSDEDDDSSLDQAEMIASMMKVYG